MRRIVVAFVLAALAVARPALAEPAPLRLTSISPAVADRGELVTIAGGGFGAGNLQVTVGGGSPRSPSPKQNTAGFLEESSKSGMISTGSAVTSMNAVGRDDDV